MRLFLALELPAPVAAALHEGTRRIRTKGSGIRWVPSPLWHLTLRFLGQVPESRLGPVVAAVAAVAAGSPAFTWSCRGLGAFPDLRRPRVLWAGVDEGRGELVGLAARLEAALVAAGFAPEEREFHPHVTLGRAAGSVRGRRGRLPAPVAGRLLEQWHREESTPFGRGGAQRVVLLESRSGPEGLRYLLVERWPLVHQGGGAASPGGSGPPA